MALKPSNRSNLEQLALKVLTVESLDTETSFLVHVGLYIPITSTSNPHIKIIGSRSRLQKRKGHTSETKVRNTHIRGLSAFD